eukprot:6184155-Pleurochrysis_carterae.AAC.2
MASRLRALAARSAAQIRSFSNKKDRRRLRGNQIASATASPSEVDACAPWLKNEIRDMLEVQILALFLYHLASYIVLRCSGSRSSNT